MAPSWLQAVVLGIVQGLTEFIPVSSSGHLVLVPYLLAWERPGLAFDVALHLGTAAAVVTYFRRELWTMAKATVGGARTPDGRVYRRLVWLLALASIPVAVTGLALKETVERAFETPPVAAGFLFVTAGLLASGEFLRGRRAGRAAEVRSAVEPERVWRGDWVGTEPVREVGDLPTGEDPEDPTGSTLADVTVRHALVVGLLQALALFPGVSRSGATIAAGMGGGLTREAATRFSFLLALPALVGAALLSLPDLAEPGLYSGPDIVAGIVASFVAGYLAIRFLIGLVARDRLTGFARYCVVAGVVGLLGWVMIG